MNGYLALALQLFALLLVAAILGVLVGHYLWRPRTTTPAAPLLAAPPGGAPAGRPSGGSGGFATPDRGRGRLHPAATGRSRACRGGA